MVSGFLPASSPAEPRRAVTPYTRRVPPHLTVQVVRGDDRIEVHAAGEVDMASMEALRDSIEPHLGDGQTVVLDLSQITFADSSLLKVLQQARRLTERGGSLVLRNPSQQARRLVTFGELDALVQDEVDRQNRLA